MKEELIIEEEVPVRLAFDRPDLQDRMCIITNEKDNGPGSRWDFRHQWHNANGGPETIRYTVREVLAKYCTSRTNPCVLNIIGQPPPPIKLEVSNCPNCGGFRKAVLVKTSDKEPGIYCNKEGCGLVEPLPRFKKCEVEQALPDNIIRLIKLQPENPTFRALVLKALSKPVPDEAKTFDQVKEWVEHEFYPNPGVKSLNLADVKQNGVRTATAAQNTETLQVPVVIEGKETGTAHYSVAVRGEGTVSLTREEIEQLIGENDCWDDFCFSAMELVERRGAERISPEWEGNADYRNHESDGEGETETHIQDSGLFSDRLKGLLRQINPGRADDWLDF